MPWYKKLHWQIIIGLILGLIFGVIAAMQGWQQFTANWVAPFGDIFMNLLMLIAIPLILASLIVGISSLGDLDELASIGGKTIGLYIVATVIALVLGLVLVNTFQPGAVVPEAMQTELQETYGGDVEEREAFAEEAAERGPLDPFVDMVPSNFFDSASDNANMLQIVFVAFLVGVALLLVKREKAEPLINFFESLNALIIKLVEIIMWTAPIGVFGLIADAIVSVVGDQPGQIMELLGALGYYSAVVVLGFAIMIFVVYPIFLRLFTDQPLYEFFRGIAPAQLVAFSTSSSGATLPVTMDCVEKNLGVSNEVSSFVVPLGATINMHGTAIYQAVTAVFIAQVLGMQLDLMAQATIVIIAVMASIGSAAVPAAGVVMLVVILEAIGVPSAGIALIMGVERPLDMLRTLNNVTGDAMVASVVGATEGKAAPIEMQDGTMPTDVQEEEVMEEAE